MKLSDSLTGLQHVGIPCENLDKAVAFYEMLGFAKIYTTPNGDQNVAFMELGGLVIELYGNMAVAGKAGAINHIALNSTDIEASYNACKEAGCTFFEQITALPFWSNGIKYFSVIGPNQEIIEVCQKL